MTFFRFWPRVLTPWKQRALCAENNCAILRRDLEAMCARYHDMLDQKNAAVAELALVRAARNGAKGRAHGKNATP